MGEAYGQLMSRMKEIETVGQIQGLLGWDQEVMMPPKAGTLRAEQMAWLSRTSHAMMVESSMGEVLEAAEQEGTDDEVAAGNLRLIRDAYDKATKKPADFVERFARHKSKSIVSWAEAREKNDFSIFRDDLAEMIELNRELAGYLGYEENPYDALLDIYESGLCVAQVDPLFAGLREALVPLIAAVGDCDTPDMNWVESNHWPEGAQASLSHGISAAIGFDFDAGRRDKSTHPFCGGSNPDDVRWTTRYDEAEPFGSLYGSLHETGHGLYEQGRPRNLDFQPAGHADGLGVHESQSRLWENQVGRSLAFSEWAIPHWSEHFSENMQGVTGEMLWRSVNMVEPSLIRVEADEATYNIHIMIRYEIEKKLINGELDIDDLPDAWDDMYEQYLGIRSPDRKQGVLQDIHWSMGAFGYFPTYTLGNLYSAQLLAAARNDLEGEETLEEMWSRGEFEPLLQWMRTNVHSRGSILSPADLIEEATGQTPTPEPFIAYLRNKIQSLYGVTA
ncbi:MAG: Thermostable carboxypeptidase 1 [Marine Group II euryarchaeote MED-G33]|nr:MAG: Thermostable carboxypeptidase 1 [Marine Group II euryarchaeote MED-G33]